MEENKNVELGEEEKEMEMLDQEDQVNLTEDDQANSKKIKNLLSIVILLAGLFAGSLFVDVSQLIRGTGFSAKNLNKSDVFEADGKTWVAYQEAAVVATVINDDACQNCDVSDALVWLRRVLPTISTEKVAFDSTQGKSLIEKYGIKTLPAFVFDSNITKSDFYSQAKVLFDQKDSSYVLNTQELGLPVGKYLELPTIGENDAVVGNKEANVKVIVFSDFQCPYCKVLYQSLRGIMDQYKDRVVFNYKELPLDIHPQANNASLAAQCAKEQGKFWEYADKLYASQTDWSNTKDTAKFKQYAAILRLKTADFNKCLDDKRGQSQIDASKKEATNFGISGTPAIFINDQFSSGAITVDQLKKTIDDQLSGKTTGGASIDGGADSTGIAQ